MQTPIAMTMWTPASRATSAIWATWSRFSSTDMFEFLRLYVSLAVIRPRSSSAPAPTARSAPRRFGHSAR